MNKSSLNSKLNYFSEPLKRAHLLLSMRVIKTTHSKIGYKHLIRHLLLANQWVKNADLRSCENPKTSKSNIDAELLIEILKIAGLSPDREKINNHIDAFYNKKGSKYVKKISYVDKMIFEHQNTWAEFLYKIKFFNEDFREWELFEYLFEKSNGTLKNPVVSFEGVNTIYKFSAIKLDTSVFFTVNPESVKITTYVNRKTNIDCYEKTESMSAVFYQYNKGFNNLMTDFAWVLGDGK